MQPDSYSMRMFLAENKTELMETGIYKAVLERHAKSEPSGGSDAQDDEGAESLAMDISSFIGNADP